MKVFATQFLLLLLQTRVLRGRQGVPRVKVKESTVHTIKLPAQPYQLKNGSYVSNPLTGGDTDIDSLLSFLKRTNILKVPTNFTSNGRPMGVSTELNLQGLNPTEALSPAVASTEKPKLLEVSTLSTVDSTIKISTTPRVTAQTSPEVTTTTSKVTTVVKESSPPKLTTTTTTATPVTTTMSTSSTATGPAFVPHRAVMWWPSLLPWHLQPSRPLFPFPIYHHRPPYPLPPFRFPPSHASPPLQQPQQNRDPSQQARVPASTTPLYLSTWLLPSHLLYKYTKH